MTAIRIEGQGIRMTLCPNCKTIQKDKSTCSVCKYPIDMEEEEFKGEMPEQRTQPDRRQTERRITGKEFLDKE